MNLITANIKWIMIVSGILTTTMIYAAISPKASLNSNFGEELDGPVAEIVVRNWGALIALVGIMLLYGAFNAAVRPLVLIVAAVSKAVFITLVLSFGRQYLGNGVGIAVAIDFLMIVIYTLYLISARRTFPHTT